MPFPVSTDTLPLDQTPNLVNSPALSLTPDSRPALDNPDAVVDSLLKPAPATPNEPQHAVSIDPGTPTGITVGKPQHSSSTFLLPAPPWHALKDVARLTGGQSDGAYLCRFTDHPPLVLKVGVTSGAQALATTLSHAVDVRAPLVRWVPSESTALESIQTALTPLSAPNTDAKHLSARLASSGKSVLLMEHLIGFPLGGTGRNYPTQHNATQILHTLGRLAAFDLIVGNIDRFENFHPNDCLGGGDLPANFFNILLLADGPATNPVAAIDTCLSGDRIEGVERAIYSRSRNGYTRKKTTPKGVITDVLARPDTVCDYVQNNIMHMLEQTWFLPSKAGPTIQEGFLIGLYQVATRLTPDRIESARASLGLNPEQVPIATLKSRLEDLRTLLTLSAPSGAPLKE